MTFDLKLDKKCPLPVDPAVISVYVPNSVAETNILVPVPWERCQLIHAETNVVTAIDATGAMEIDLELNAAGGTEMMTISVAGSSAVGTIDTATVSSASACKGLSRSDASYDYINVEVDGSAAAAGAVMLYLFFQSDRS
jgi:hypothetical protein